MQPCGDSGSLLTLFSRFGMNPQQLRYSIRRPASEPAFRRDREVFHIFFCRCQAPARADQSVGVMHEAETQLGLGAKYPSSARLRGTGIWINWMGRLIARER